MLFEPSHLFKKLTLKDQRITLIQQVSDLSRKAVCSVNAMSWQTAVDFSVTIIICLQIEWYRDLIVSV
ncbi:hypothetical protein APU01nite_10720 [Alkalibacterium putridalgicola]|uniref:Uncharacterized protein n=1 Tax=Alkalibacterium putridalgicola TaxID=426703 RepID=A0ABQ0UWW9_9LACT|nr:hypothetical protein APU01nite_10720 [Alkalibacterium putridalgicola]